MSALTDLFTSMANKIRSKVGGSDTYTPTEMVSAIDDVYDAGYADATTPITPSNANPVEILANTGYKPTANGYAIESINNYIIPRDDAPFPIYADEIDRVVYDGYAVLDYNDIYPNNSTPVALNRNKIYLSLDSGYAIASYDSVTPSSTPTSVASGDIVKIGGSGVIVDAIPIPTSITPSDSSPVSLTSGLTYKMGGGGYAIESSPASKTPSNTSPASVTSGQIIRNDGGSTGYLIASSPTAKTPNDSSPPSVSAGDIIRVASYSGYLYRTQQGGGISDEVVTMRYYGSSSAAYYYFRDISGTTASSETKISYTASTGTFDCPFFTATKVSGGHLFNATAKKNFRVIANSATTTSTDNVVVKTVSAGTSITSARIQTLFGLENSYSTIDVSEV